jgi:hypothetical protein
MTPTPLTEDQLVQKLGTDWTAFLAGQTAQTAAHADLAAAQATLAQKQAAANASDTNVANLAAAVDADIVALESFLPPPAPVTTTPAAPPSPVTLVIPTN